MKNKILIVASHPDDEILGCGGTVARMVKEGAEVHILILGEGVTSRYNIKLTEPYPNQELENLKVCSKKAGFIIGILSLEFTSFPDNRFDSIALLEIVKVIERRIEEIKPSIIFTHFKDDLNIDHRITYQAVITATRPMPGNTVKEIYSFEIPSSTEWAFPTSFSPDVFWDIDSTLDQKIKALDCYRDELRPYPHPRSVEGIEYLAGYRGMQCGCEYAEAFKTVRVIR